MSLESYGVSDAGCKRLDNQDRILLDSSLGLYLVCDGMGGHQHGELAAELAITAVRFCVESSKDRFDVTWPFGYNYELSVNANRLVTAVRLANREVCRKAEQALECAGMGTTVAAILFDGTFATIAHVGDSRVYLLRAGALQCLTADDTMMGSMLQRGLITEEQLRVHPMRNVLTQAAGSQEVLDVHVREELLSENDVLLMCSDGLHSIIPDDQIRILVEAQDSVDVAAHRLIDAARQGGAPDNVSVLLLRYS